MENTSAISDMWTELQASNRSDVHSRESEHGEMGQVNSGTG